MHLSARKPRVPAAQVASAVAATPQGQAPAPSRRQRLLDRLHHRASRGLHAHDARPDDAQAAGEAAAPRSPETAAQTAPGEAPASPGARLAHAFDYFHRSAPASPTTPAAEVAAPTPGPSEGHHFFAPFRRPASPALADTPSLVSSPADECGQASGPRRHAFFSTASASPGAAPQPAVPTAAATSRHAALFDHLRHPFAGERAPLTSTATPATPATPSRAKHFWHGYGSFLHHDAQPSAGNAARARVAVAAPPATLERAVGEIQAHAPAFFVAPTRALDDAFATTQARGRGRLDGLLDAAAEADKPRALVRQYVRERCALQAGEKTARGLLLLRDAALERGGRVAANWVARKVGQGAAWSAAGPLLLVERSQAPQRALRVGNAAANAATWPGQGVVTLASVSVAVLALSCGGVAAAIGLAVGYVVAGAILALVPTAVLHGWLRGRALERAAHHRAEVTLAWLRQHLGDTPMTPGPRLQHLEAGAGLRRTPRLPLPPAAWDALTAQDEGYAQDVAHAVAYVADPPAALDDQVALAETQMERAVTQMPAPLRLLLDAQADGQLVEAHREATHALGEARRQKNAERIQRQRLAAAAASAAAAAEASEAEATKTPSPASVDSPRLAE